MNQGVGAFDWLKEKPDLYFDVDLVTPRSWGPIFLFGSFVLTRFPFTDFSTEKRRPALVMSRDDARRQDLVLCFMTSRP